MEKRRLGRTDLFVSRICLGTMTFGEQNTEQEGHEQLDLAFGRGVNFIDTAELYPIPPRPDTQGRTERTIGSWMKSRGTRDKVVLATKVYGNMGPDGEAWPNHDKLSAVNIRRAVDASLKRLGTDYIDLCQFHHIDRNTPLEEDRKSVV